MLSHLLVMQGIHSEMAIQQQKASYLQVVSPAALADMQGYQARLPTEVGHLLCAILMQYQQDYLYTNLIQKFTKTIERNSICDFHGYILMAILNLPC